MTRVIHTGDTHLGYRQYHSPERRADFLRAFRDVVRDALDGDVDAVVHAGDLFHDRQPSIGDVYGAIEVLRELRDGGVPFLAVVGNHELTRDRQWLDLFERLGLATRLGREPTVIGDVAFYGLDFVPRSRRDDLDYDFAPADAPHAALVAHGLFTPFPHADWETGTVLAEATVDFDAMLLGDNHAPDVAEVDGTWVTYCGSTERADASERADRGYNLVTFDDDGVAISRRGLDTRDFVFVDLDLAPGEGPDRVRERLREEPVDGAVVIVGIEGDGGDISPAEVEAFARDRGALVARVTDRREIEAAEVPEVRFVDPDEAVRERVRELGLSEAALAIDDVVRSSSIRDSNVRDRARERIDELLDADPAAFATSAPRSEDGATAGSEAARRDPAQRAATATGGDGTAGPGDGSALAGDGAAGGHDRAAPDEGGTTDASGGDGGTGTDDRVEEAVGASGGEPERDEADAERGPRDRTTTMEDFL